MDTRNRKVFQVFLLETIYALRCYRKSDISLYYSRKSQTVDIVVEKIKISIAGCPGIENLRNPPELFGIPFERIARISILAIKTRFVDEIN